MRNRILWTPLITMALLIPITSQAQLISVQGTGTVEIEAEFATLAASVIVDAQTAALAQTAADKKMAALLTAIAALPRDEQSIEAGQLRIQPQYRWNSATNQQEFQGYQATRELSFKLLELTMLGEALQTLSSAGASSAPPQFGSSQTEAARNQALTIAFDHAKADALALAKAADTTLGAPETISTGSRPITPQLRAQTRGGMLAMEADRAPPRYEPGQLSISATVSVMFQTHNGSMP
jgi:uncharacterized protein YggE